MADTILRTCNTHGEDSVFVKRDKGYRCRACAVDSVNKRRRKVKQLAIEYKGGKCVVCGYDKCPAALEFHHEDPSEKEFALGSKGHCRAWEDIQKELDKCILVCSNCHKEIHYSV